MKCISLTYDCYSSFLIISIRNVIVCMRQTKWTLLPYILIMGAYYINFLLKKIKKNHFESVWIVLFYHYIITMVHLEISTKPESFQLPANSSELGSEAAPAGQNLVGTGIICFRSIAPPLFQQQSHFHHRVLVHRNPERRTVSDPFSKALALCSAEGWAPLE